MPLPERTDRKYVQRTDCGNDTYATHLDAWFTPLISYSREATETQTANSAWCELNSQKMCADAMYNKDWLFQAKAVDYPRVAKYDPWYCHYNGWLGNPQIIKLYHDYEGLKALSTQVCNSEKYAHTGWNTTMTLTDMTLRYAKGMLRGQPTEEEALFVGAWTCAMGSSGCDMAYCAYSFCDKGDGKFGMYEECEGWDPVQGMPSPEAA